MFPSKKRSFFTLCLLIRVSWVQVPHGSPAFQRGPIVQGPRTQPFQGCDAGSNPAGTATYLFKTIQSNTKSPLRSGFFAFSDPIAIHPNRIESRHGWPTIWPTEHRGAFSMGHFLKVWAARDKRFYLRGLECDSYCGPICGARL